LKEQSDSPQISNYKKDKRQITFIISPIFEECPRVSINLAHKEAGEFDQEFLERQAQGRHTSGSRKNEKTKVCVLVLSVLCIAHLFHYVYIYKDHGTTSEGLNLRQKVIFGPQGPIDDWILTTYLRKQ